MAGETYLSYCREMVAPVPYLHLPGNAADALRTYQRIFGGELHLFTYGEFQRTDGDAQLIAHGELRGAVDVSAADVPRGEPSLAVTGILFALLGRADAATSQLWFDALATEGLVLDPLQRRPWGDYDGQVRDAYGVTWLIGYQAASGE